jgi:hypothetical protein
MSAIRLYGDTSGYTEIAAPSVAGNDTITLPSGSGTILTIDGSQNISVSGIITATSFKGDGSGLTGIGVTRILSIGRRTTPYEINLVGSGITVALRSGIGTINF